MCGNCGSNTWELQLKYGTDGTTTLVIICGNKECVKAKRKLLQASEDSIIIWEELDITGQGYDLEEDLYNYDDESDPSQMN
jgi:hypothetical protein